MGRILKSLFAVIAVLATSCNTGTGDEKMDDNVTEWEPLLPGTDLEGWTESGPPWTSGEWSRTGETITGHLSVDENARITRGDSSWSDYEFSVYGTLVDGSNLQVQFRVSGDGETYYMLDCGYGTALSIRDSGQITHLSRVRSFPFEKGQEYHIVISARGSLLSSHIDGKLVNQVIHDTFDKGGVGLNMWHTTTAKFRDPRIRHYR